LVSFNVVQLQKMYCTDVSSSSKKRLFLSMLITFEKLMPPLKVCFHTCVLMMLLSYLTVLEPIKISNKCHSACNLLLNLTGIHFYRKWNL
jgi:hypothetical protein